MQDQDGAEMRLSGGTVVWPYGDNAVVRKTTLGGSPSLDVTVPLSWISHNYDIEEVPGTFRWVWVDSATHTIMTYGETVNGNAPTGASWTRSPGVKSSPRLCYPWVVWKEPNSDGGPGQLMAKNVTSPPLEPAVIEIAVSQYGFGPSLNIAHTKNGQCVVVWDEHDPDVDSTGKRGYDTWSYNLDTHIQTPIAVGPATWDLYPDISGDMVIWSKNKPNSVGGGTTSDGVWAMDLTSDAEPTQIVPAELSPSNTAASISGDWIVWENGYHTADLYAQNLISGWRGTVASGITVSNQEDPLIDGNTIVYNVGTAADWPPPSEIHAFRFPSDEGSPTVVVDTSAGANTFSLNVTDDLGVNSVQYAIQTPGSLPPFIDDDYTLYPQYEPTYTAPSSGCTVWYEATDISGNVTAGSQPLPDMTAPTVTPTVTPFWYGDKWCKGAVTHVSLAATDAESSIARIEYRVLADEEVAPGEGEWWTYSDPFGVPDPGRYRVWYRAVDAVGNWSDPESIQVWVDGQAPTITVTVPQLGSEPYSYYEQGSHVPSQFSAVDDMATGLGVNVWATVQLPDSPAVTISAGDDLPASQAGLCTITVHATDGALNESTQTGHYWVYPAGDLAPPTTTAALAGTLGTNGWYRSAVTVTLSPTDAGSGMSGGQAGTWYSFDNGVTWTAGTSVTKNADGTYTMLYYSKDAAGNREANNSLTFKVDATLPVVTVTKPLANDYYTVKQKVYSAGSVGDGSGSGVATTVITNDTTTTTWGAALNTATTGTHTFQVVATDYAGNQVTKVVTYRVGNTADKTPPTVTITNPEFYDGQSYPRYEQLSIDFTVSDSLAGTSLARWSVSVKLPSGTTIPLSLTPVGTNGATTGVVPALTDTKGAYQATITAKDGAGQTTTVVVNYAVAADWGQGLLAFDTILTPNNDPPTINVTNQPIVPLKFTLSGDVRETLGSSSVISGLKPRLYVVDLVTNKLVYKAPTYFQLGADGFYTFSFDTRNIACIPSAGRNFKHIVVFCDPLGAPKFTCGSGGGAGRTTTTDLTVAGTNTVTELTPVTSDTGVLKVAGAGSSTVLAAAVATPSISAVAPNPAALTTGGIASVTLTGSNFGSKVVANYVSLTGFDASNIAWKATTQSTSTPFKLGLTSWGIAKIVFTTPANVAGTMNTYVNVGTAKSGGKPLTVSVGSATGTIRYIRGG